MGVDYKIRLGVERRVIYEAAAKLARRTLADWMKVTLDDAADRELSRLEAETKPAEIPTITKAPSRRERLIKFQRSGIEIVTMGVDFGPRVTVIVEAGDRMLWKVPGHKTWAGNYQPWRHEGTLYLAVEESGPEEVRVIREEQPGARWRAVVDEMTAWVVEAERSAPKPGKRRG